MLSLSEYLSRCVSPYHCIEVSASVLREYGFSALPLSGRWKIEKGGKYYVNCHNTMLAAFTVGESVTPGTGIRIAAAHTDWPCLYVKAASEQVTGGCLKLSVEPYGGLILSSWIDRPLSIAGAVTVKSDKALQPEIRLIDMKEPVCYIPNLAIHMNREVNKGVALSPAKDMLPICRTVAEGFEKKGVLQNKLAELIGVQPEDILCFDLLLYNAEAPCLIGFDKDLLSGPRLDNLTSAYACLAGMTEAERADGINVIALFDNEEVGSRSKAGADSGTLPMILEKLTASLGLSRAEYLDSLAGGFLLSCDVAHALHPNYTDKYDSVQTSLLNRGVSLKLNYEQKYATQCGGVGAMLALAESRKVPCQVFMNKPDARGGSTLGAFPASSLSMQSADIGVPILAMHSAREIMGVKDQEAINRLVTEFFRA